MFFLGFVDLGGEATSPTLGMARIRRDTRRQQSLVSAVESRQHRVSVVELMDFAEAIGFDPRSAIRRLAKAAKR